MVLGFVLIWAAYGVSSYGWVLLKGYNITARQWFSPLHPFSGDLDSEGCVPKGHIFPVSGQGGPCTTPKTGNVAPGGKAPAGGCPPGMIEVNGRCLEEEG